jgi:hypothetical protein
MLLYACVGTEENNFPRTSQVISGSIWDSHHVLPVIPAEIIGEGIHGREQPRISEFNGRQLNLIQENELQGVGD